MKGLREEILQAVREKPDVPVLILGAGVNGTGLFRELALQDVGCLLVDKADFVSGASSKSSRMIHGGLRYLENREIRLVRESLFERNRLLENASHTVSPLKTTMPLFSWMGSVLKSPLIFLGLPLRPGGRGAVVVKLGLLFYDLVTRKDRRTPRHVISSKGESLRDIPGLHPGIVATATYWDALITQAERLCIELIQDARAANPDCRALNYVSLEGIKDGAVILEDRVSGATVAVRPKVIVNATGAWVDITNAALGAKTRFIGGTKGSHLVVEHKRLHDAIGDRMIYYEHEDGRVCIVFTFQGKVVMGSTEIHVQDPDTVACDDGEIEYMLETLRGVFPDVHVAREDFVFKFCGVRPLPRAGGDFPGKTSRSHSIQVIGPDRIRPFPIFCLFGGKWTTFRALAEQAADMVLPCLGLKRKTSTAHTPIGGGRDFPGSKEQKDRWIERAGTASGLSRDRIVVLLDRYGMLAGEYLARLGGRAETPLKSLPGYTAEEIRHIVSNEFVEHLTDLTCRRTLIALLGEARREVLEELSEIVGAELDWDPARREEEVEAAVKEVAV